MVRSSASLPRVEVLARRVGWLDRNRRLLAITLALASSPLLVGELSRWLGSDWPQFHATLLGITLVASTWLGVEIALAGLTAAWDTECARLAHGAGLPRAEVLSRRDKRRARRVNRARIGLS